MKKKTIKNVGMGLAVALLAVGASSWTTAASDISWYFTGTLQSEANDETKWTMSPPSQTGCSPSNVDLPCELKTPDHVTTEGLLKDYFESNPILNDDPVEITSQAETRRNN